MITNTPGITVAELQDAIRVLDSRVWQIVSKLQRSRVALTESPDPRWPLDAAGRP
jgi:hypothetical protein